MTCQGGDRLAIKKIPPKPKTWLRFLTAQMSDSLHSLPGVGARGGGVCAGVVVCGWCAHVVPPSSTALHHHYPRVPYVS